MLCVRNSTENYFAKKIFLTADMLHIATAVIDITVRNALHWTADATTNANKLCFQCFVCYNNAHDVLKYWIANLFLNAK